MTHSTSHSRLRQHVRPECAGRQQGDRRGEGRMGEGKRHVILCLWGVEGPWHINRLHRRGHDR